MTCSELSKTLYSGVSDILTISELKMAKKSYTNNLINSAVISSTYAYTYGKESHNQYRKRHSSFKPKKYAPDGKIR